MGNQQASQLNEDHEEEELVVIDQSNSAFQPFSYQVQLLVVNKTKICLYISKFASEM